MVRTPLVWLMAASFVFGGAARHRQDRTPASPKPGTGGGGPASPSPPPESANLIGTYCVSCHNDRAKTGGLSLQALSITHLPEHAEGLEKGARGLRAGGIPPATGRPRAGRQDAE